MDDIEDFTVERIPDGIAAAPSADTAKIVAKFKYQSRSAVKFYKVSVLFMASPVFEATIRADCLAWAKAQPKTTDEVIE